ncbi:DinB family protein [Myroides sp. DF42-4-2]|uniref:DinB family protein n=1 Tax=unclassified Myroides TaxID=2642485 RepID=UPI00257507EB|nr:DinB family protein [Myroides sp. DF42-4-2]MDM1407583.1 DinB family protein [Myroides sp. DF42-4-2]
MDSTALLSNLLTLTHQIKKEAEELQLLPDLSLQMRPRSASWSIVECIEHLNYYGYFYLPEITIKMSTAPSYPPSSIFKSGYFGNYLAKRILPKAKLNKIKAAKAMNPSNNKLDRNVLTVFIQQQNSLIALLEQAKTVNLNRIKTSTSIHQWIKLRLGDTLKLVVFHNLRHMVQIQNILVHQKLEKQNYLS